MLYALHLHGSMCQLYSQHIWLENKHPTLLMSFVLTTLSLLSHRTFAYAVLFQNTLPFPGIFCFSSVVKVFPWLVQNPLLYAFLKPYHLSALIVEAKCPYFRVTQSLKYLSFLPGCKLHKIWPYWVFPYLNPYLKLSTRHTVSSQ